MKYQIIKDLKKAIVLLAVISFVASCSMDENFSCDRDANKWANNNLTEIRQMSSKDFIEIGDLVYMRAAYNVFTPDQRQSLWIEKLETVLKLDWTEKESQFIESMLEFLKANSYFFSKDRDLKEFEKIEIELYKFAEYAREELKWDNKLWYRIVGTPQEINENKEIISKFEISPNIKTRGENCDCNSSIPWEPDSSGNWFLCNALFHQCDTRKECDPTSWGCGNWWWYGCNGICV